jgi:DNA-directed RNA polymerase subunit M/transcription elongation factor TFIIS
MTCPRCGTKNVEFVYQIGGGFKCSNCHYEYRAAQLHEEIVSYLRLNAIPPSQYDGYDRAVIEFDSYMRSRQSNTNRTKNKLTEAEEKELEDNGWE